MMAATVSFNMAVSSSVFGWGVRLSDARAAYTPEGRWPLAVGRWPLASHRATGRARAALHPAVDLVEKIAT
jgi:hypothetical protein